MTRKVKITFVLPEKFQEEFRDRVIKDYQNLKGKSQWVSVAIEELLRVDSFSDLVKINDEMRDFNKLESVVIFKELKQKLDAAIITVRKKYPAMEGVQSKILRTAIVQRLILNSKC